jgi:hypothetical protein
VLQAYPENSNRFLESCILEKWQSGISKGSRIAATEWDCQDYVLKILDNLEEECVVDGDDKTYEKQKNKLKNKRGEY